MACLLVLFVAAAVLTAPPAKMQLASAAPTPPAAEAFWRAALPDAPMPEAIRELLHPASAAGAKVHKDNDDDHPPLPPLNFKYDDYKASPRNQAAAPSPETLKHVAGGARNAATTATGYYSAAAWPAAVFFLEDAALVGGSLPLRSIPEGAAGSGVLVVVCRRDDAVPDDDGRDAVVYGCRAAGPAAAARSYAPDLAVDTGRGETVAAAVVVMRRVDHTFRRGPAARAAFRLLGVKLQPGGAAVVRHAVLDAPAKSVKSSSSA